MHELQLAFRETLVTGLRRKSITSPATWAESYRMMGKPIPGKWAFKYHPWLRGMHDAKEKYCVGQKAAQVGYTEALLNITFYKIDICRENCMYVLPSKTPDASNFSSSRFDAALELSPHLQNLFSSVKNVGHKRAGSANLYIQGSNSRGGLKSMPVSFMVFDEVDEMNQDNIILGEERVSGQFNWQIWKISTPTVPNRGINGEFNLSTQDHFTFKCPCCGRQTELIYPDCLVVCGNHRLDPDIQKSHIICKECKKELKHQEKHVFLGNGKWVPFGPADAPKRGFHISQLYSSTIEPGKIAQQVFDAQVSAPAEQELFNSKLGLPSVPKGAQVMDHEIDAVLSARVKSDPVPKDFRIITMGVDQGKWLHYEVDGWRFQRYGTDLNMMAEPEVIAEGKVLEFEELGALMRQYQVLSCVIDAQPERRKAYEFACSFPGHVKTCFYSVGASGKQILVSKDDDHRVSVDRTSWLDVALNRFHAGSITLPRDITEEYRVHMQNQVRRYETDSNGNPKGFYVTIGDDHLGHARCYAEIALPIAASMATNENIGSFL